MNGTLTHAARVAALDKILHLNHRAPVEDWTWLPELQADIAARRDPLARAERILAAIVWWTIGFLSGVTALAWVVA
jgi:hypothetical protein